MSTINEPTIETNKKRCAADATLGTKSAPEKKLIKTNDSAWLKDAKQVAPFSLQSQGIASPIAVTNNMATRS